MKSPTSFVKVITLLLIVFCSSAMTCNKKMFKLLENAKITLSPEEIVNINGRLEFSATLEYETSYAKEADSLEVRFYLKNSQIETLLGSIKDADLNAEPKARILKKTFKTTWFSKVPITEIEARPVIYKKGKSRMLPGIVAGRIVSKPGDRP